MFITKRKYEDALRNAKREVAIEWERKMCDMEKRIYDDNDKRYEREEYYRRFNSIEERILTLEKKAGLVEETKCCPCEVKRPTYY